MRKRAKDKSAREAQEWFLRHVTYKGEAYTVDLEQAAAIADSHKNTIVVARAGSGKTRTLVAKIIYLVAKCGVRPEAIMAFVFNANAAAEINARLSNMLVDGESVMNGAAPARTFHAFARRMVYEVCGGKERCGKILVDERDDFIAAVIRTMLGDLSWRRKMGLVVRGNSGGKKLSEAELLEIVGEMSQFINRAGQRYLGGESRLREKVEERLADVEVGEREKAFLELGLESFRRYHWYLLNGAGKLGDGRFEGYGTDFNLLVSWAGTLIRSGREEVRRELVGCQYILIDEYQDFSQLFLSVVMAIRGICPEVRLFVVGDDWQAINRFAGSEVGYFKEFEKYFPEDVTRLGISMNYRCNFMVVETARKFVARAMGEKGKFKAYSRKVGDVMLVEPRKLGMGVLAAVAGIIIENRRAEDILMLHRNNETNIEGMSLAQVRLEVGKLVVRSGKMTVKEYQEKVRAMTMHKSKGLEAEVVIILEADEGVIPRVHPDTSLYNIFGETNETALADQERLFYVAMTRAKKRLYIIHNSANGAGFMKFLPKKMEKWGEF